METKPVQQDDAAKLLVFKGQKQFNALGTDLDFNKEATFAIQIIQQSDMLTSFIKSNPQSIINSIVNIASIGLTLNPALAFAYLVPRDGKCILDISYRGMIKILTDAGGIRNIDADDVYENDHFVYRKGTDPVLKHSPAIKNRGEYLGTYAIAYFTAGGSQALFMNEQEIKAVEETSKSKGSKFSPWQTFRGEMQKKTVIKRLYKILPKSNISDSVLNVLEQEALNNPHEFNHPEEKSNDEIFNDIQYEDVVDPELFREQ